MLGSYLAPALWLIWLVSLIMSVVDVDRQRKRELDQWQSGGLNDKILLVEKAMEERNISKGKFIWKAVTDKFWWLYLSFWALTVMSGILSINALYAGFAIGIAYLAGKVLYAFVYMK